MTLVLIVWWRLVVVGTAVGVFETDTPPALGDELALALWPWLRVRSGDEFLDL